MESAQYPMRGRGQVPPAALDRLFRAVDDNESGTVTFDEFVGFVRKCNPVDEDQPEGWAAFVGAAAAAEEEKMVLHVGRTGAADRWRKVRHAADTASLSRSGALLLRRIDAPNAEMVVSGLRELRLRDDEIVAVIRALFVTQSDEDYAKVRLA